MKNAGNCPFFGDAAVMLGSHTIPAAWAGDSSSDKATHSAILQAGLGMAMSGVSFWGYDLGGFYHTGYTGNEERPEYRRLSFLCTDGTCGCPYPEHMAKHRESLGSMEIWP